MSDDSTRDGTDQTTTVAVNGATGRMGETVRRVATDREETSVVLGIATGGDDGELPVVSPADRREALRTHDVDVVVDFSAADVIEELARDCASAGVGLVSGTTGLDEDGHAALQAASEDVPVLHATNFSRGLYALLGALEAALETLPGYDVEVLETHHNRKQDAPSGTATTILETIADQREFETVAGREGLQPREESEVGMLVRRAGNVRGEHEVMLADNDEVLTLTHRAENRGVFAAGALDAAGWLVDRETGWYTLDNVFDETD